MKKQLKKVFAERTGIYVSKFDSILNDISSHTVLRHPTFSKYMNWDEFKTTKDTKEKMSFIIANNESGNIFDIQDLEEYFRRHSRNERDKVKLISTDFYSEYIHLVKKLFKNADIVIDKFHILIQAYNALNVARVKLYYKDSTNYNKLKDLWRLVKKVKRLYLKKKVL